MQQLLERQCQGSLLTRFLALIRHTTEAGAPFEAVLMDNVARPPPGVVSEWKPFDIKGIRLYPHETRFSQSFGAHGLFVSAPLFATLRHALSRDVALLTSRALVDYSFLLSVFPAGNARRRSRLRLRLDLANEFTRAVRIGGRRAPRAAGANATSATWVGATWGQPEALPPLPSLVPAIFCEPAPAAAAEPSSPNTLAAEDVAEAPAAEAPAANVALCSSVVLRVALIDFLREWSLVERAEHVQKTLLRDLRAGSSLAWPPLVRTSLLHLSGARAHTGGDETCETCGQLLVSRFILLPAVEPEKSSTWPLP